MMRPKKLTPCECQFEFAKIQNNEIWRFYIDGYRQSTADGIEKGMQLFDEKEPGYIKAMFKAHEYMCKTFDYPLTPQLIINLHQKALDGVANTSNSKLDKYRDGSVAAFGLVMNDDKDDYLKKTGNVSIEGIKEFLQDITQNQNNTNLKFEIICNTRINNKKVYDDTLLTSAIEIYKAKGLDDASKFLYEKISTGGIELFINRMTHTEIESKVASLIIDYNIDIANAVSEDDKLVSIIKLVKNLERLHPFSDGNCRTFVMLLLNRELIINGFPPTMLDNPNRFDFHSINELKNEIKIGFENAKKYRSQIASLPSFKGLFEQVSKHNEEKLNKNQILFNSIKDKPLSEAIIKLSANLNEFNKGGGLVNSVIRSEKKSYKFARALLEEMKKMQTEKQPSTSNFQSKQH